MGSCPYVHFLWLGSLCIVKVAMGSTPHEGEVVMGTVQ
jgi:hypothetical protein